MTSITRASDLFPQHHGILRSLGVRSVCYFQSNTSTSFKFFNYRFKFFRDRSTLPLRGVGVHINQFCFNQSLFPANNQNFETQTRITALMVG